MRWPHATFRRKLHIKGRQEVLETFNLFRARRIVDAIEQRHTVFFERLGRSDIRLDHIFLDELMRIETHRHDDRSTVPSASTGSCARGDQDQAVRAGRGRASAPRSRPRAASGCPRRASRRIVRMAVDGVLCLLVGEFRRRSHHDAMKRVVDLVAIGREPHAHRKRRAIDLSFNEQRSLEIFSGSIGTTRSGK